MCLHNLSVAFQSSTTTPTLCLLKWRYRDWNKLLQNKWGCEFRLVSNVCAHSYSKTNIGSLYPGLLRTKEFLVNDAAFIAGSAIAERQLPQGNSCVWYVIKVTSNCTRWFIYLRKNMFPPQNCPLHVWRGRERLCLLSTLFPKDWSTRS